MARHYRDAHQNQKEYAECSECKLRLLRHNLDRHMLTHTEAVAAHCDICDKDYKTAGNYRLHCQQFAYEHDCIESGNFYSRALDERISGSSDGRREEQLYDEFCQLFSLQTPKHSSLYVLVEVATTASSTFGDTFSAFLKTLFYVGSTEIYLSRQSKHQRDTSASPAKLEKMRQIWASGGNVHMIEVGGLTREEAQLAEGATIDAIGTRNLANEVRGRSNMAGKDFANDRHSFAMIGVRFLEKLYAAAQDGKGRALNRHEYKLNV